MRHHRLTALALGAALMLALPVVAQESDATQALLEAARNGDLDRVRAMIDADPNRPDEDGNTALDLAREAGHAEVVGILEKRS